MDNEKMTEDLKEKKDTHTVFIGNKPFMKSI